MLHSAPLPSVWARQGHRLERCGCAPSRPTILTHRRLASPPAAGPEGFSDFQKKASKWVADNKLEEKAAAAAKTAKSKLGDAYDNISASARTTYAKLDSEYKFGEKVASARKRVDEAWKDVDQEFGVRRKLRSAREELQRRWPTWQKQIDDFLSTDIGKGVAFFAFLLLLQTSIFWSIVNTLFLLWWLSIPLSLILLGLLGDEATKLMEEQAAAQQEMRGEVNPFEEMFNSAKATGGTGGFRSSDNDGGPVIDAEYTVLDDDRKKK